MPMLRQRVIAILRAKQYLVFFAIALLALDYAVPLVSAWLYRRDALVEVLARLGSPFYDAAAARSVTIAAIAVAFTLVTAFFRAGYIRSIIGRFHPGPRDVRQFTRLLALQVIIELIAVAPVLLNELLPDTGADSMNVALVVAVSIAFLLFFLVYLAIVYADYIIVVSGLGPLHAIARSWRVVRLNLGPTLLVVLAVTLFGTLASSVAHGAMTGIAQALPLMVIQVMVTGVVLFVADVVLVVLYLETLEAGRLRAVEGRSVRELQRGR
jgi:hypothetical protein